MSFIITLFEIYFYRIFPKRIKRHLTFCWAPAKSLFFYARISVPPEGDRDLLVSAYLLSDNLRISDDLLFLRNQLINFSEKDQIALSFVRHGSLQSTISGKNPWSTYKCWEESKMACLIQIQYTWKLYNINQQSIKKYGAMMLPLLSVYFITTFMNP